MPKTVAEVLAESGWTPEQIAALDAKQTEGFTKILSTAEQMQEAAELAKRAVNDKLANEINPALDKWANDEARLKAEAAFYRTQAEAAKAGGFLPADAPGYTPAQGADGKFVAGGNAVPGSPDFKEFSSRVGQAIGNLADLQWKYRKLYGEEMPDSPTSLGQEAAAQRMDVLQYAAKKYNFAAKETELQAAKQKERDDKIRAEVAAERDKHWAEKVGNNPMVRQAESSKFTEVAKAVQAGSRPDPLKLNKEQRHAATSATIQAEIVNNANGTVQ